MTQRRAKEGATAVAPSGQTDTFSRVRAHCVAAPGIDVDKHAAQITEVVALAKLRDKRIRERHGVQAP